MVKKNTGIIGKLWVFHQFFNLIQVAFSSKISKHFSLPLNMHCSCNKTPDFIFCDDQCDTMLFLSSDFFYCMLTLNFILPAFVFFPLLREN